jgi:formylmethanofuran dehydrogenase subunit C
MLHLTPVANPTIPVELDGVTPDRVAGLSPADVARLPVFHGNRREELGAFFTVSGDASYGQIMLDGSCPWAKGVGARMTAGRIFVEGDVGMHAGAGMAGGELSVRGHAGDWLGAEMRGGRIRVLGSAGHQVGAAYRGSRKGMTGGEILISGNAGDEAGLLMRRGIVVVGGRCGAFAGASMIAGSVVALGGVGPRAGAGMKRGTIFAATGDPDPPPSFRYSFDYRPAFAGWLARFLRDLPFEPAAPLDGRTVRCYRGDLLHGGKGELLVAG